MILEDEGATSLEQQPTLNILDTSCQFSYGTGGSCCWKHFSQVGTKLRLLQMGIFARVDEIERREYCPFPGGASHVKSSWYLFERDI